MQHKLARAEVNKIVRQVLARHRTDIALMSFHVHGREVEIQGIMWHTNDTDFTLNEIDALLKDFQSKLLGFEVKGVTENWVFSSSGIKNVFDAAAARPEPEDSATSKQDERELAT